MTSRAPPKRDIQWADGLRGIACFLVVVAHGFQGFGNPPTSFDVPFPFALPFFRLFLHGGFLSVSIFFVMSGYVCSIKPLKLVRAGRIDETRAYIASSAFKRVLRLGIPATVATCISWFLCQVGAYSMAYYLPGDSWLNFHSARPDQDWGTAIAELWKAILHTWTYDGQIWSTNRNRFEMIQWTLAIELRGSLLVYFTLVITAAFTPLFRRAVFVVLLAYSVYCGDLLGESPFYIGALLADLSIVLSTNMSPIAPITRARARWQKYWPIALATFALYISSYPTNNPQLAGWSRSLIRLGHAVLHPQWEHRWAFTFIGAVLLIFSIHYSPILRHIFSYHPFVFFGSISFPVYLTHSLLMRTVLVWIIYGIIPQSPWALRMLLGAVVMVVWLAGVMFLSVLWRDRLDTAAGVFTQWVEDICLGKRGLIIRAGRETGPGGSGVVATNHENGVGVRIERQSPV